MKTIYILLDSLNRDYLPAYGGWAITPNIDRLAARGTVFDNHYCGSLPCMPARRDMLTGRLNFLEAPWGPIEPWDDCLPVLLRRQKGVYSHLITDHYHYFHSGGECYHTQFDSWEFERGQENDAWRPLVGEPALPATRGKSQSQRAYWANRAMLDSEADEAYSTPRCFQRAIEFIETNHGEDNWHLHLEVFDPHEPFDCPSRYLAMYDDTWDGRYLYNWPRYGQIDQALDDAQAVAHVRKRYAGTLTMADTGLGRFLDKLDEYGLWEDTTVVLSTDHGHLLGERGYWGKNQMFDHIQLARIPLIACHPGSAGGRRVARGLTSTIDLAPTVLALHGAQPGEWMRGRSLLHLLEQDGPHHAGLLYGYFGKDINFTDGRYTYCRQPLEGAAAYHHTAMPRAYAGFLPREMLARAETGTFLPYARGIPHYRMAVPARRHLDAPDFNPIYDVQADPRQAAPIHDPALEARLAEQMRELMRLHDAPESEYARVGLG
jgi:arylsulfatase A-like enzyme